MAATSGKAAHPRSGCMERANRGWQLWTGWAAMVFVTALFCLVRGASAQMVNPDIDHPGEPFSY